MADANDIHAIWRVTHHAELSLAEANLLYWIDWDIQQMELPLNKSWTTEQIFLYRTGTSSNLVRNYIHGTCKYLYETELDSANVRCTFENVANGTSGIINLPKVIW